MSVNTRFLEGPYLKRYETIAKSIEKVYEQVVKSVSKSLQYVPTVYVTPYVIQRKRVLEGTGFSLYETFFNLNFLDPDDLHRRALYSTIEFFEKFPKYVPAGFGHEIAHQISEGNRKLTKRDLLLEGEDPTRAIEEREARKNEAL